MVDTNTEVSSSQSRIGSEILPQPSEVTEDEDHEDTVLDSGEFFIATQIRVPEVFPETWPIYADDHCCHEWAGFETTTSEPNDAFGRTIEQFVTEAEHAAAAGWRDFVPQDR